MHEADLTILWIPFVVIVLFYSWLLNRISGKSIPKPEKKESLWRD